MSETFELKYPLPANTFIAARRIAWRLSPTGARVVMALEREIMRAIMLKFQNGVLKMPSSADAAFGLLNEYSFICTKLYQNTDSRQIFSGTCDPLILETE